MRLVVLTGAGISAESGLKTFRDQDGLWEGHRVEDVATPEAFVRNPPLVYEFYNQRRAQLLSPEVQPNPSHFALAKLESALGERMSVITQNVDDLHERAGQKRVLHMHGELLKARCLGTGKSYPWLERLDENSPHPDQEPHPLRPDIVWFGEMPFFLDEIDELLRQCEVFLCIGTSGQVYPAAGFVQRVPPSCEKIEFNLQTTALSSLFDRTILGPTSQTLPAWVHEFIKSHH